MFLNAAIHTQFMGSEKGNGGEQNATKPYVRYRISSDDIKDKGICFTAKRAVTSFFQGHNIPHRFQDFSPSESSLDLIVELFPSENDYNIGALQKHLETSGRIPSSTKLKPSFQIIPVPCDYIFQKKDENNHNSSVAWEKTIGKLQEIVSTKDKEIEGLKTALAQSKDEEEQVFSRIQSLEQALEAFDIGGTSNPIDFILNTYFKREPISLFEAGADYQIASNINYNALLSFSENTDFLTYVNGLSNLSFKSEGEFREWLKEVGSRGDSFEESSRSKSLLKRLNEIDADNNLFEMAKESGSSQELIALIKTKLEGSRKEAKRIKLELEDYRGRFDKEKEISTLFENVDPNYQEIKDMISRSKERRDNSPPLYIFSRISLAGEGTLRFYLPCFDSGEKLERLLHQYVSGYFIPREGYSMQSQPYSDFGSVINVKRNGEEEGTFIPIDFDHIASLISTNSSLMENDKLLNFLGIKTKLVSLIEH